MTEDDHHRDPDDVTAARAEAREAAEQAHAEARQEQEAAERARGGAEHHRDVAASAAVAGPGMGSTTVTGAEDEVAHGSGAREKDAARAPEDPGRPVRRSPFHIGFTGALGVLTALVVGVAVREVAGTLQLILISAFLAVGLNPLVERLMLVRVPRPWAVLAVTLGFFGVVTLFGVALFPVVRDQVATLIESVPGWLDQLQTNNRIRELDAKYDIIETINEKLQDPALAESVFGSAFAVGVAVLGFMVNAFIIFVLTVYFLIALPSIKQAGYSLAPATSRPRVTYLGDEILRRVGGYVGGVFVVASCAGMASFIFLELVGLSEYSVALAIVVMIADFVPLVGATIGASVVTLIGFATDLRIGIICAVFFLVYQQVENYVIYPRVMASSVDVPGVVTVIAVLLGGGLLGVPGAMMAIPTAAAVLLLTQEVIVRRQDQR